MLLDIRRLMWFWFWNFVDFSVSFVAKKSEWKSVMSQKERLRSKISLEKKLMKYWVTDSDSEIQWIRNVKVKKKIAVRRWSAG